MERSAHASHASDAELLAAAGGDAAAFRLFYDRYAREIFRWLRSNVDDDHAAEDLLAETFAQAWLSSGSFRDEQGGSARPWLYGIARHVLLESYRKRRVEARARERLGMHAQQTEFDLAAEVVERLDAEARRIELGRALHTLPDAQRQAVGLHVVGDLPYDQVARIMQSSAPNVRMRAMRGLRRLREVLELRSDEGA